MSPIFSDFFSKLNDLQSILITSLLILIIIGFTELLNRLFNLKSEYTRKFIHFAVGIICVLLPVRIDNYWLVIASNLLFILLLLNDRRTKLLSSININGDSLGDVFLPVAIGLNYFLVSLYNYQTVFYLPLIILTISDPLAFFSGKLFNTTKKSIPGSIAFFISTALITYFVLTLTNNYYFTHQLLIVGLCAVVGTFVEYISVKGWDNITIPLTIGSILVIYTEFFLYEAY